ncbi:MAG: bifunctional folylpolyglutamate synthase/dihydrofolate synthase [Chloroflexota bacterium]|nr:bifunctional folylpolyglutamate synthase/dihydrofolate synthase [Chloroflexota bacterium]
MFDPPINPSAAHDPAYLTALGAIRVRANYEGGSISDQHAGDAAARLGQRRVARILDLLERPQDRYGIVHVAGSKGKGSTCAMLAAVLTAAGCRTGRGLSPHLHTFRERIVINGESISDSHFATLAVRALAAVEHLERDEPSLGQVTAFELLTVMSLDAFARAGCKLAVIETGIGGTLDATNVVEPLVSLITALDFEHTAILGTTLAEIAANKAGIIKPGRPVAIASQVPESLAVITAAARAAEAPLLVAGRDWTTLGDWRAFSARGPWGIYRELQTGMAGSHQVENAGLAIAACLLLRDAGIPIDEPAIRKGLASASLPARFETVELTNGPTLVVDGAHTPASAQALATTLAAEFPGQSAVFVLGMMRDKDPAAFAVALAPLANAWITTQTLSSRAFTAADTAAVLIDANITPVRDIPEVKAAIAQSIDLAGATGLVVVTGSLALAALAREALGLAVADP